MQIARWVIETMVSNMLQKAEKGQTLRLAAEGKRAAERFNASMSSCKAGQFTVLIVGVLF
jgi:hypothetical protein